MHGMSDYRRSLVGVRLPEGRFTVEESLHRMFCEAVFASGWESEYAHPLFLYLAAHCGKGMSLSAFFKLLGTELEAGVTFGEGALEFHQAVRIGAEYRVHTTIADVVTKVGRRRGAFDVVTCDSDVLDLEGQLVGTSREAYIVPAAEGSSSADCRK